MGGEEIGDLELLDRRVAPPAEDRPEMMMTNPGRQHEEVVKLSASLGRDSRFFNSCCCASMLSAMVLEKAPESECDGMVSNSQHLGGWLMVPEYQIT
jgi:hypothetical protein